MLSNKGTGLSVAYHRSLWGADCIPAAKPAPRKAKCPTEKNDQAFTKPTSTSCHTLAHCML